MRGPEEEEKDLVDGAAGEELVAPANLISTHGGQPNVIGNAEEVHDIFNSVGQA